MNSHYLVDFDPVFIALGPLKIHWYGITYLIGFACYWLLGLRLMKIKPTGWNKEQLSDFMFYGAMGVVVGGRVGWWLFYNDISLLQDPLLVFKVWQGGMSFHGGLLGVVIAMFYFKHQTHKTFFQIADFVAPLIPTGIISVRLGNFINGELWGRLTNHSWGMIFPQSLPSRLQSSIFADKAAWLDAYRHGAMDNYARHPSPLYEAFGEGLVCFITVWLAVYFAKKRGTVSAVFLITYAVARFSVEFVRQPDANRGFIFFDWMTMGHILTIPLLVAALLILWFNRDNRIIQDLPPQKARQKNKQKN